LSALGTLIRTKLAAVIKDGSFCEQMIVSMRDNSVSWMTTRDGIDAIRNICYKNAPFAVVPYSDFNWQPTGQPSSSPSHIPTEAPTIKPIIATGSFIGFLAIVVLIAIIRFSPSLIDVVYPKLFEPKNHLYNILVVIDDNEEAVLQNIRHQDIVYYRRTVFVDREEGNQISDWTTNKASDLLEKRFEVQFIDVYNLLGMASNDHEMNDTDGKNEIKEVHNHTLITGMIVQVKPDIGKKMMSNKTSNSEKSDDQKGSIDRKRRKGSVFGERRGSFFGDKRGSIFGGNLGFILGDKGEPFLDSDSVRLPLDGLNIDATMVKSTSIKGVQRGSIIDSYSIKGVRRGSVIDSNSVGIDMLSADSVDIDNMNIDATMIKETSIKGVRKGSIINGVRRGSIIHSNSVGIDMQSSDMDFDDAGKKKHSTKEVRRGSAQKAVMEGVRRGPIIRSNSVCIGMLYPKKKNSIREFRRNYHHLISDRKKKNFKLKKNDDPSFVVEERADYHWVNGEL
jgi:hypothetical protein